VDVGVDLLTTVDASGSEWQLSINGANFRGPGTYTNRDVQVSLQAPDNSRAWLNQAADPNQKLAADKVTFTIDRLDSIVGMLAASVMLNVVE
jgi:hypothetical protein